MYAAVPNVEPVSEAQRSHRQIPQGNGVLQMQESPDLNVVTPPWMKNTYANPYTEWDV